jgi:exodeoxyribonuclease VII large subunit
MLERQLAAARAHLERTSRLLDAVNPDALLQRGYVRVSVRADGAVVTSAAAARAAGALTLHFGDGPVDARVERAGGRVYDRDKPEQPTLL